MTTSDDFGTFRPATDAELIADITRYSFRTRFRHHICEQYRPDTKRGVQHKQYNRARAIIEDGKAYVMHHGRRERLIASAHIFQGKTLIFDIRLEGLK